MSNNNSSVILPQHLAIIMDGNGRWAKRRGLPRIAGHKAGADRIKDIVAACNRKGIKALTLFAFSTENWQRPKEEVEFLMRLIYNTLERAVKDLNKNNIRIQVIGRRDNLEPRLFNCITNAEAKTAQNTGLNLVIAFNYSGKWDIVNAATKLAQQIKQDKLRPEDIDEVKFNAELALADLPAVDLLIRTSGEIRISNFLLWQIAYSELYFTKTYWPDFKDKELDKALGVFAKRERRFGRLTIKN